MQKKNSGSKSLLKLKKEICLNAHYKKEMEESILKFFKLERNRFEEHTNFLSLYLMLKNASFEKVLMINIIESLDEASNPNQFATIWSFC